MAQDYQEIISKVSKEVAKKFLKKETNLAARAILLDADISEITRQIGLETTKIVFEHVRDNLVKKNKKKDSSSKIVQPSTSTLCSGK